jgi:hypothetical protein
LLLLPRRRSYTKYQFRTDLPAGVEVMSIAQVDAIQETDAHGIAPGHQAIAVVLDLVNPIRARRRLVGGRWQARFDEGVLGRRRTHTQGSARYMMAITTPIVVMRGGNTAWPVVTRAQQSAMLATRGTRSAALALIEASQPRDEIEAALALQMACTHIAAAPPAG